MSDSHIGECESIYYLDQGTNDADFNTVETVLPSDTTYLCWRRGGRYPSDRPAIIQTRFVHNLLFSPTELGTRLL